MSGLSLYLLTRLGGETVAFAAETVGSVVELGPVTPVPRVPRHVAGLCALRSRVLTVIDADAALGLPGAGARPEIAVMVEAGGHGYALAVTEVEDVVEGPAPQPCAAALPPAWARVASGTIELPRGTVLLVDPAALIDGPPVTEPVQLTR